MSEHGRIFTRPDRRGVFGTVGNEEDRRRARQEGEEQERRNRAFINPSARPSEVSGQTGSPDVQILIKKMREQLEERYEKTGSIVDTGLPARPMQADEAETGRVIEMPRRGSVREEELGKKRKAA
jgi:hypothetical protein